MSASPTVSIVTATYNRSSVLRFAIESVRAQTFTDWELIVVGDACTDDTEDVVRSFGDPRIRFVNRTVNAGEQSTPNNEGVRLAHGEFVAFLNHDDFWTREHLQICLDAIGDREFVATLTLFVAPAGTLLLGVCPGGEYEPGLDAVLASSWLMRRGLAMRPWRLASELHYAPSQDWLYRAWNDGHRLRSIPRATVIAVPSGIRKDSYVERESATHVEIARQLREDPARLVELLLTEAASRATTTTRHAGFRRALTNLFRRAAIAAGLAPHSLLYALRYGGKGKMLDGLRRTRGLTPLPRPETR